MFQRMDIHISIFDQTMFDFPLARLHRTTDWLSNVECFQSKHRLFAGKHGPVKRGLAVPFMTDHKGLAKNCHMERMAYL